jgi:ABC-type bacteriocin/lantibiotic exporter with double-glycine peptidase domain
MTTFATGTVFWLINRNLVGLAEAVILLPTLYLGLAAGEGFSFSWGTLAECLGYIDQVFDFLNQSFESSIPMPSKIALPVLGAAEASPPAKMALYLDAVNYKYPQTDKVVLSEISYTFTTGTFAIVGPNGAGKSTLVKLLTGLLTPTSGSISVQLPGQLCLSPEQLHKAVLFQEPSHLYLTIRQNMTMRFEQTPGEEVRIYEALEKAGLDKVVKGLPNGLDTLVGAGFGGQTDLSGGQWQRLALARLIYQDAPVIILDEPVASLDPQGERAIFALFSHLAQSKIIIFTTHRYDSIPKGTKIIVLMDGIISESGTHEELLQNQRDYWSLLRVVPKFTSEPDHTRHLMNVQTRL